MCKCPRGPDDSDPECVCKKEHIQKMKKAQLEGKIIECLKNEGEWVTYRGDMWLESNTYRIKPTAHKHAALIKAWADCPSLVFQFRTSPSGAWYEDYGPPDWNVSEIRIKPVPKPDMVRYAKASHTDYAETCMEDAFSITYWSVRKSGDDNVVATFDGETGKLKSVSLL